jgi:hypothetical protein
VDFPIEYIPLWQQADVTVRPSEMTLAPVSKTPGAGGGVLYT